MRYSQQGVMKDTRPWGKIFVAGAAAVTLSIAMFASAFAAHTTTGCSFTDTVSGGTTTWSLDASCTTSATIDIPSDTVLDGNDFTISASPTVTGQVLAVTNADDVTINDLTVEGVAGVSLRGINVYQSENVALNDVTILNNDKYGLVVNGSEVAVDNLTTSGNGWGGVNVDLGTGVTDPAALTITGDSTHSELIQVYVDDSMKAVTVNDVEDQYAVSNPQFTGRVNDRLYTLKTEAVSKDSCKNGGYMNVYTADNKPFKNQGQCVAYVQSSANSKHNR